MRATLDIDDTVLNAARSPAEARGISTGRALSELARRGLERTSRVATSPSRFPVIAVSPDAPPTTTEMVATSLDEE